MEVIYFLLVLQMGCFEECTSGDVLLSINFSMVQSRIFGTCEEGSSIREIDSDGNVVCEMDDNTFPEGNIVAAVSTGKGLVETGENASHVRLAVDMAYVQRRISGNCSEGEAIQSIFSDGSVLCESMPIYKLNKTAIRMQTDIAIHAHQVHPYNPYRLQVSLLVMLILIVVGIYLQCQLGME